MNSGLFKLWAWNRVLHILQNQETEQGLFHNQNLPLVGIERDLERIPHLLFVEKHKESLLAGEILDPHLEIEVDLGLHQSHKHIQILYGKEG